MWRFSLSFWMYTLFFAIFLFDIMSCNFVLKPKHCMEAAVSRESRNAGHNILSHLLSHCTEQFDSLMLPPLYFPGYLMLSWFSFAVSWGFFAVVPVVAATYAAFSTGP